LSRLWGWRWVGIGCDWFGCDWIGCVWFGRVWAIGGAGVAVFGEEIVEQAALGGGGNELGDGS